jgi:hypothetical protein
VHWARSDSSHGSRLFYSRRDSPGRSESPGPGRARPIPSRWQARAGAEGPGALGLGLADPGGARADCIERPGLSDSQDPSLSEAPSGPSRSLLQWQTERRRAARAAPLQHPPGLFPGNRKQKTPLRHISVPALGRAA